jgi:hypothetical protein
MTFIRTPLTFQDSDAHVRIVRDIEDRIRMLDNLIELIIFTPRGSFMADPDFGFEYWNHEYSNIHYREFNSEHNGYSGGDLNDEITKEECKKSICQSLEQYEPQLKQVNVSIEINAAEAEKQRKKKVLSKYVVTISVEGIIEDGLGTTTPYKKDVVFLMEPTAKKYRV